MTIPVQQSTQSQQQTTTNHPQNATATAQDVNNFDMHFAQANTQSTANTPTQTGSSGSNANTEPKDSYYSDNWKLFANRVEDKGARELKEDFSNLKNDIDRTAFVGKLFHQAGELTGNGKEQVLGHNLNGALNLMDTADKTNFSKALNQAYNSGQITKEDIAAVLSDESIKIPQVSKTPTGSISNIIDSIKNTGNDKMMGDSFDALWRELTTDKDVSLHNIKSGNAAGSRQERFVDEALDLAIEMQKNGNNDGIMSIVDTFNDPNTKESISKNFFAQLPQFAKATQTEPHQSGKLDDFIDSLAKINPTPATGKGDAEGINDRIENTIQLALPHIKQGDADSINALSNYLLNGTTTNADGSKDYTNSHLQRFLTESTQSAGNNSNDADDNSLFAGLIRQTVLNQGNKPVTGAADIAKAVGDLTQQKIDNVNNLDLTAAERKRNGSELGTLIGSVKAAATDKVNDDSSVVDFAVDWLASFIPGKVSTTARKPVVDASKQAFDQIKEVLGAAASSDTAEIRSALEELTGFEEKVIDNTAAGNQPIERITDVNGNLTEAVKQALGTPDARTVDDLTDGQRFKLDHLLKAQETSQEIPAIIREAVTRITDSVYVPSE